ncbi:hypothetical protein CHARACLAT_011370 [Characodon lateralis]|uniref:Uncharacterized protein n=1 Tax=Characodon lateralis TaxID=208331 RepID=A0ABU7ELE3_9TELE|nr:hypothetical protein [Characodon lateralis]
MPSLSRKQGSLTTDSRESCLMMLFSLSVFRFWYISWLRSWRKWFTLGLVGLGGRAPADRDGLPDRESSQPWARSRQQLQQSRPMGERQSSSDILAGRTIWDWAAVCAVFLPCISMFSKLWCKPTQCHYHHADAPE